LIRLRRLKMWHLRTEELIEERLQNLQGASAEKEYQCKRIVSLCTGIPIDKVEEVRDTCRPCEWFVLIIDFHRCLKIL
jgi:regulatory protein SWI6